MDESQRQAVLGAVLGHFGVDKYNRLVLAVKDTKRHGKFRYWQDELFSDLRAKTGLNITTVKDYVEAFHKAPTATKEITLEQFLAEPSRYYYMEPVNLPNDWIAQAWEQSEEFRQNVTYEYAREASKNGDLGSVATSLRRLASVLPINRSIELYCAIRDLSPHRESEFRRTFERIFRSRMAKFPPARVPE